MNIKIKANYKSMKETTEFSLPNFTVLTGKNGSGKTHLLEAIANKQVSEIKINDVIIQNIRYIGFNQLSPNIQENCDPITISQYIKSVWTQYTTAIQKATRTVQQGVVTIQRVLQYISDENMKKFVQKTFEGADKSYEHLSESDFTNYFEISYMGNNDFLIGQFALIFKDYHTKLEINNMNKYYKSQDIEIFTSILTDEEFIEKYGPKPWDFVNEILAEANIPYEVNNPMGTRMDSSFQFRLKDRIDGFEIKSIDLSTGEKVLMSLALAIYNIGEGYSKPDLLLIDEPDAALHPSMSQKMIKILSEKIVKESNTPTIITTHSPTTVMTSQGISVFQLERGNSIPKSISIQNAIELLSGDIPFLKISNDKRRQVFVESKYDVIYYELLSNIFSRIEELPSKPIFIPARTSNGSNCTDVIEVVNSLSSNGNDQVYGIIDWDTSNKTDNRIIVLGEDERYAIENYILDPLLMGLFFIRENKVNISDFESLSFDKYFDSQNMNINDAQVIINKILNDLELFSETTIEYTLYNSWKLNISDEFNKLQGHTLESLYKEKYPFLNAYQREESLKKDIIEKVVSDHPLFTPNELYATISKIR